jgi:hypothetical protein
MFRVSHRGEGIDDADEIRAEPFPSGHTSRQWGRLVRHPDGRVEDQPWPWETCVCGYDNGS